MHIKVNHLFYPVTGLLMYHKGQTTWKVPYSNTLAFTSITVKKLLKIDVCTFSVLPFASSSLWNSTPFSVCSRLAYPVVLRWELKGEHLSSIINYRHWMGSYLRDQSKKVDLKRYKNRPLVEQSCSFPLTHIWEKIGISFVVEGSRRIIITNSI